MFIYLTLTDGREVKFGFAFKSRWAAEKIAEELSWTYDNVVSYAIR